MTEAAPPADPRPQFAAALDQVEGQIKELAPADLDRPTPCADFDVRTLVAHLVAVMRKLAIVRAGGTFAEVSDPADDLGGDGRASFEAARAELDQAWLPDAALDVVYTLPYGSMTGRELLDAYTHEFTVHAWDLWRARGGIGELDPVLAEAALAWYQQNVGPDERGPGRPFGPITPVHDDADAYTQLAAYVGRSIPDAD